MVITKQRRIVTIRLVQFHNMPFTKLIQCQIGIKIDRMNKL